MSTLCNCMLEVCKFGFCLFVLLLVLFYYSFIHMCIHCLGHFPSTPHPPSSSLTLCPLPSCFQVEPVLHLSLILLKRRHKHNKEDKVFLLVELIRIAIQRFLALLSCSHVLQPILIHL
jgi:hypothetical protein